MTDIGRRPATPPHESPTEDTSRADSNRWAGLSGVAADPVLEWLENVRDLTQAWITGHGREDMHLVDLGGVYGLIARRRAELAGQRQWERTTVEVDGDE